MLLKILREDEAIRPREGEREADVYSFVWIRQKKKEGEGGTERVRVITPQ